MPNWVKNKIIVGKPEFLDEIKSKHCHSGPDEDKDCFDFNTIKKMPEEMNIEYGSRSDDGLALYLTKIDPKCKYFGEAGDKLAPDEVKRVKSEMAGHLFVSRAESLTEDGVKTLQEKYKEKLPECVAIGEKMVGNVEKFGAMNWYEWAIKNWGTKWNSSNTEWGEKNVTFETAWDPALPAIVEMSKQHPKIRMAVLYSDEDIGSHVGYMLLTGGHVDYEGTFTDQSRDAYKLAFDLWGCGDEYRYNEKKGTYERKPDDPMPTPKPGPVMA
jgi:hypothetical protein